MKNLLLLLFPMAIGMLIAGGATAQVNVNGTINNQVNDKLNRTIDKVWDSGKNKDKKKDKKEDDTSSDASSSSSSTGSGDAAASGQQAAKGDTTKPAAATTSIKAYQNYDFVPGDKIIFEDNFTDDMDGEFPAHWELSAGQAIINKVNGEKAFYLTDGNYAVVKPRMKTEKYFTDPFTVEFDYYNYQPQGSSASYGIVLQFSYYDTNLGFERNASAQVTANEVSFNSEDVSLQKAHPVEIKGDDIFCNKWHHVAIAFKNKQMKIYVDQYRVLVVPDTKCTPDAISFAGIASDDNPIIFRNVRLAEGGGMNMLNKLLTDGRFVTRAITFDVNKSTIKPESMGFLNDMAKFLKDNGTVKLEIDGHTDSDGDDASNLKLSQSRADAVKTQLVSMGIDGSRLTTKGFGETKPVDNNTTPEGKANNRRVEFVKQ